MNEIERIKELTTTLNSARNSYYNNSSSPMSDYEYDKLYDELVELESSTGIIYANSPSQTVGYIVQGSLLKVKHKYPMLSLAKTKKSQDLIDFLNEKDGLLMLKCDGLTTCLTYDGNGDLIQAETRGDGITGTLCTENVKTFNNVPLHINHKGTLIVYGESIVKRKEFEEINSNLYEDNKFKTQRNMASGSLLQLDNKICAERHLSFIAWRLVEGSNSDSFKDRLDELLSYGFDVVPWVDFSKDIEKLEYDILTARDAANSSGIPIDGLVVGHNSISYGESLGSTSHHRRAELAFKFGEDEAETTLIGVDFTMGKTGTLTPVLHFKPVELMDTTVEYASAHNLSIMKKLGIKKNCNMVIVKKNDIIPQCIRAYGGEEDIIIPTKCPICNGKTTIVKGNDTEVLVCSNNLCKGKLLGKLSHAVSKNALNIDGLSEETLSILIDNHMVEDIYSIYELKDSKDKLLKLDRFGKKKVENLLTEIENSKDIKLENYLYAWSIPLIGRSTSKDISKFVNGDINTLCEILDDRKTFTSINGFGDEMQKSLSDWWNKFACDFDDLAQIMRFEKPQLTTIGKDLTGTTFVITGSLNTYENRDACKAELESLGAKVSGSVSAKTSYLINNDNESVSGKNKKAKELGIPIITEEELLKMIR